MAFFLGVCGLDSVCSAVLKGFRLGVVLCIMEKVRQVSIVSECLRPCRVVAISGRRFHAVVAPYRVVAFVARFSHICIHVYISLFIYVICIYMYVCMYICTWVYEITARPSEDSFIAPSHTLRYLGNLGSIPRG